MVKDHLDSERENLSLSLHGLLFPIVSKVSFICTTPDRIVHTVAFITPVEVHFLEREMVQWIHHEEKIQRPIPSKCYTVWTERDNQSIENI